jgi:hypothetical protein
MDEEVYPELEKEEKYSEGLFLYFGKSLHPH